MNEFEPVAAHRRRIADVLEGLSAEQLSAPSLCDGWTVKDVAGHLTAGWHISTPRFVWSVFKHRGDFHAANIRFGKELGDRPIDELVADLRANALDEFTPPGAGVEAPLSDAWIHAQDMFVPLGIEYDVDVADAMPIIDMLVQKKSRRVRLNDFDERFSWRATDTDWAHTNDGAPEFAGPLAAVVLALFGRGDLWGALDGPVEQLTS